MKLSKILHRNEFRIKLDFAYGKSMTTLLRQEIEMKWSQTHKAWHAPYQKAVFDKILELFPNADYEKKHNNETLPTINQPIELVGSVIKTGEIKIVVLPKNIHI